jgi:hypothetical protein
LNRISSIPTQGVVQDALVNYAVFHQEMELRIQKEETAALVMF